jgi:hypothetical protein
MFGVGCSMFDVPPFSPNPVTCHLPPVTRQRRITSTMPAGFPTGEELYQVNTQKSFSANYIKIDVEYPWSLS